MKRSLLASGLAVLGAVTTFGLVPSANGSALYTGTSGDLSASALFDIDTTSTGCSVASPCLKVTLTNTGAAATDPADALTALFFNIAGDPNLSSDSAVLGSGSTIVGCTVIADCQNNAGMGLNYEGGLNPADGTGVVGGEWAYLSGLNQYSANQGLSSSGFALFSDPTFPGSNLFDPVALDGVEYGIVDGLASNANSGLTSQALISNSVVFLLDSLPAGFDFSSLSNVTFQYGTSLTETHIPGSSGGTPASGTVPEPDSSSLALLGLGIIGVTFFIRRRSTHS